jgi:AcrR family transcriptional regulator
MLTDRLQLGNEVENEEGAAMIETARAATRGPYRTGVERRAQLVAIAIEMFGQRGFAGSSLRTIADRAGVSHATLIRHFGTKEGLLIAVLQAWERQSAEQELSDVSGLAYLRRLPDIMAGHRRNRGLLELFTTITAEASNPEHPAHDYVVQRYETNLRTFSRHLQEAVETGDVGPLSEAQVTLEARLLTAALDGIGLQWLLDPSMDIALATTTYLDRAIASWRRVG